jgi:DnaD/phage-associated family protein
MSEQQEGYITDAMEMIGLSEPRQIVTEVSGFIPVFEVVLMHYKDHMTALVFGRMWQYCGMSDGVCRATIDRLANDLQISGATVMRHIEKLEEDGYIYDSTPARRNRPHEYVDCGKVVMKGSLSAIAQKNVRLAQKNVAIAESQLIKQDNTKDKTSTPAAEFSSEKPNIFKVYEQNIGALSPLLADELKEIEKADTEGWFEDAVKEALKANVRNLKYIKAILARWKVEGRGDKRAVIHPQHAEGQGFYA